MSIRSIGVTGTNGKTTTTTWIAKAWASDGEPVVRVTTVGFFLTTREGEESLVLPPSREGFLEAMRALGARGGRRAAIEFTSEALAHGFARTWPVEIAVFTNLTHDHLDAHASPEHYLASKAQLFVHLPAGGVAVLNGCDPASALLAEIVPGHARIVRYGVRSRGEPIAPLDARATDVRVDWSGTTLAIDGVDGVSSLRTRGIGEVFAENALAALVGAIAAGANASDASEAISRAAAPPGRFEALDAGDEAPRVVVDYAHSPDALSRTIATARSLADRDGASLTVVFGAGGNRDRDKRAPMGEAARLADRVILTTDNPRHEDAGEIAAQLRVGLSGHRAVDTILDRRGAIERAILDARGGDVVLLAGRGHETEQTIGAAKVPFSDAAVAREVVARRCGKSQR